MDAVTSRKGVGVVDLALRLRLRGEADDDDGCLVAMVECFLCGVTVIADNYYYLV